MSRDPESKRAPSPGPDAPTLAATSPAPVRTTRSRHGPFERIVLTHTLAVQVPGQASVSQLSVYRLGDTLFDTGSAHTREALVAALADAPPARIVLTHQHEDHAGGVQALRRAFGPLPVHVPRAHLEIVATCCEVPPHRALFWGHPEPFDDGIPYDAGDRFELHGLTVETLATPGHTPGHITPWVRWGGGVWALTGDLYFGRRLVPAWHEASVEDQIGSLRAVAGLGPEVAMLPTHGKVREADGCAVLLAAAEAWTALAARVRAAAAEHEDGPAIAEACFGPDLTGLATGGEVSHLAAVRGVLDPVRALPAPPLEGWRPPR